MIVLLISSAIAAEWECGERSNLPQAGKNYCAAGDFRQSEINMGKALNTLLEKYMQAYGNTRALNKTQSAFASYRDNQCAIENKRIEEQSFHSMIVSQCKTRFTNLRIDEINRMLQKGL